MAITYFSPIPYFLIMLVVLFLAWLIVRRSVFYKNLINRELGKENGERSTSTPSSSATSQADGQQTPAISAPIAESKSRYGALDGLRGILAISVLFQHAVTNYAYFSTGIWQITDVRFYRHLGGESVILFFMITSFLYWSKAIASLARPMRETTRPWP